MTAITRIECEFLGTGTSYGVPSVGCDCPVCSSSDPRNKRMRSSVYLRIGIGNREVAIVVDTTPDFRSQALRAGIRKVDAVIFTHDHADHTHGIDDLRAFYWLNGRVDLPIFGYSECIASIQRRFRYIFDREHDYAGVVRLAPTIFEYPAFDVLGVRVVPIPLVHGAMRVAGVRIGDFAYLTDTNLIPPPSMELLRGVRLLVIDALRRTPHQTHLSLPEALRMSSTLGVEQAYFTHINHDLEHAAVSATLPPWAHLGYDTLRVGICDNVVQLLGDRIS